jgi:putative component of membrane protein insertase Oxa1/YidC/SpoIIIJ protein YidD
MDWLSYNYMKYLIPLVNILLFILLSVERPLALDQNPVLKFYQEHISVIDGHRCPMYPSCSSYASEAFHKHGPILGWIMTCDRIVRCGRDEDEISLKIMIQDDKLIYDPLDANDFWWFEKDKK